MSIKLSLIELGAVNHGQTRSDAIKNIVETAQKMEEWGYNRIWLAEHHNTENFVSRAPEVIIPLVASNTSRIRVGSGSVLLNHYSPFKVAEVFTLLGDMFPGRIDMGIGRATTGPISDFALQRNRSIQQNNEDSEEQLMELVNWLTDGFDPRKIFSQIKAHHDGNNLPEFWLLGSSQWSAYTAGSLGLNYAFAGFINPDQAYAISHKYRDNFSPGAHLLGNSRPRLMLSLSIYCADTVENAGKLAAPMIVMMHRMRQGDMNSPVESEENAVSILSGIPAPSVVSDVSHIGPGNIPHYLSMFEGVTIMSAISMVTKHLGLSATVSTSYADPYSVARQILSLDKISKGRASLNAITSNPGGMVNFSRGHLSKEDQYPMQKEFMEILLGLWDTYEDDAFIRDKKNGIFINPHKMHALNYKGK